MRAKLKRYQYPCVEMIFPEEKENTESQAADCHVFFSRFAFDIGDPPGRATSCQSIAEARC
jgi:hypothetical protein